MWLINTGIVGSNKYKGIFSTLSNNDNGTFCEYIFAKSFIVNDPKYACDFEDHLP